MIYLLLNSGVASTQNMLFMWVMGNIKEGFIKEAATGGVPFKKVFLKISQIKKLLRLSLLFGKVTRLRL